MMLSQVILISLFVVALPKDVTGSAPLHCPYIFSKYINISLRMMYMYNSAAAMHIRTLSRYTVLTDSATF